MTTPPMESVHRPGPRSAPRRWAEQIGRRGKGGALMSRVRSWRTAVVVVLTVMVAAVVLAAAGDTGNRLASLRLGPGTAWFASPADGFVVLVDGLSGDRLGRVKVAERGEKLEIAQQGTAALVLNRTRGTLRRVDGASLTAGPLQRLGTPEDDQLKVVASAEEVWALRQLGTRATQLDPVRLDPLGPEIALGGAPSSDALVPDGTLWVDGPSGLRSLHAGQVRSRVRTPSPTEAVVSVGERAVAVDPAAEVAYQLDRRTGRRGRSICMDGATEASVVSGSGAKGHWVVAVDPTAGGFVVGDAGSGRCWAGVAGPPNRDRYGRAVESEGLVYLPDHEEGTVVVVDPSKEKSPVVDRVRLGVPPGHRFTLFAHDSLLWWDDPDGDAAGVITPGLMALSASKTGQPKGTSIPRAGGGDPRRGGVACRATPDRPQVGQLVTFDAITDGPQPARWQWSFPGGTPPGGTGPVAESRWTTGGDRSATVTATYPDRPPVSATCTVGAGRPAATPPKGAPSCLTPPCPPPTSPTSCLRAPCPPPPTALCPKPPCPTVTSTTLSGSTSTSTTLQTLQPGFTVSANPVVNRGVTFTDTSTGGPTQWQWTFERGTPPTSTQRNPVVTYSAPSTYTVVLTVSDAQGVTGSLAQSVTVTAAVDPTLTVGKSGSGTGSVTSSPGGISCGTTCSMTQPSGTSVTLTATPDAQMTFGGWSGGGCTGTGTCTLTLDTDTTVTAAFDPATATGSTTDLGARLSGVPSSAVAGAPFTFTASVDNSGPDVSTGAMMTISLDPALQPSVPAGCFVIPGGVACPVSPDVASGGSWTSPDVTAVANGPGTFNITATVSAGAGAQDPASGNNTAVAQVSISSTVSYDLGVTLNPPGSGSGGTGLFQVTATVRNSGPSDLAAGVATVDVSPPSGSTVTFVGPPPSGCTQTSSGVSCSVDATPSGSSFTSPTLTFAVGFSSGPPTTDLQATVTTNDGRDPNAANNSSRIAL